MKKLDSLNDRLSCELSDFEIIDALFTSHKIDVVVANKNEIHNDSMIFLYTFDSDLNNIINRKLLKYEFKCSYFYKLLQPSIHSIINYIQHLFKHRINTSLDIERIHSIQFSVDDFINISFTIDLKSEYLEGYHCFIKFRNNSSKDHLLYEAMQISLTYYPYEFPKTQFPILL